MKIMKNWQSISSLIAIVIGACSLSHGAVVTIPTSLPVRFGGPTPWWGIQTPSHTESRVIWPEYNSSNQNMTTVSSDLDVNNSTIRVYGTVAAHTYVYSSIESYTWQSGTNPPVFPNGPTPIYSTAELSITVSITVPSFTFDTGTRPFSWDGNGYSFENDLEMTQTAALEVTHSLVTGDDVFAGTFTLGGPWTLLFGPSRIGTQSYPNQLTLEPELYFGFYHEGIPLIPISFGEAENGFNHSLYLIPEPSGACMALLSLGLVALRRRR